MKTIEIVATGVANIASVTAAFKRLGFDTETIAEVERVANSDYLVLPGVGSFGSALDELQTRGLVDALRDRIQNDRPTLGICLGLQLLGVGSEESPGVDGLGVLDASTVVRMAAARNPVPQMGWNDVKSRSRFFDSGCAYFANSYAFQTVPEEWLAATYDYEATYVAAVERGNVIACQFHPELSGEWGAQLLQQWVTRC